MKALILGNKVVDLNETEFEVHSGLTWVDCDNTVTTRHTYSDGIFTAPVDVILTYAQKRASEYPPVTDYLDGIVKGDTAQVDKYIADCQAVKLKYPKEAE